MQPAFSRQLSLRQKFQCEGFGEGGVMLSQGTGNKYGRVDQGREREASARILR